MTARSIMVQGTMSGAGKSLLAAALCRVLRQDGYRVAPFKSQNMALNSAITADGLEMGRAQVVQAQAAGVEPEVAMNPILLKPTTDTGSQVIVMGKPIQTMPAKDYLVFKHELRPQIAKAYDDLAERFDVIVIEGAGSPAEVNLKDDDIVNMGMARMAKAPVLLVGDIDRGGVFAQLIGTMALLDPDERAMVKATVVNKFRGDASILEPGLDILREKTGVPVAGVVPYADVDIDDEDSMSSRLSEAGGAAVIDIAVMRLPRLSNFTDFIALEATEGVGVRYVGSTRELGSPDLVIVPGTKSTMADLRWLRESGLEAAVKKLASRGVPVIGICGGYQMLGERLADPHGGDGGGEMDGMGLLPTTTVFSPEKRTARSRGEVLRIGGVLAGISGLPVEGYEIHMGRTEIAEETVGTTADSLVGGFFCRLEGDGTRTVDGCWRDNVYGTYLHGLFDNQGLAQEMVAALARRKGIDLSDLRAVDMAAYREEQYDRLADVVRDALDMELVYRILDEGLGADVPACR